MGLIETIERGITLSQKTTPTGLITLPPGKGLHSGSTDVLGGAFILLGVSAQRAGRIRFYSDKASMDLDDSRAVGDFAINDGVGLVSEVVLITTLSLNLTPPLIGTSHDNGNIWYKISGSTPLNENNIILTYYPLTDIGDATTDRTALIISGASLPTTGNGISGSVVSPKSFLILSASANVKTRLRLYAGAVSEIPSEEPARSFSSLPSSSAKLITDMMFDSASYAYKISPTLEAYTWQGTAYTVGTNQLSYIMKNESGGSTDVTASLHIFSIED